jgi:hypothetical protein
MMHKKVAFISLLKLQFEQIILGLEQNGEKYQEITLIV